MNFRIMGQQDFTEVTHEKFGLRVRARFTPHNPAEGDIVRHADLRARHCEVVAGVEAPESQIELLVGKTKAGRCYEQSFSLVLTPMQAEQLALSIAPWLMPIGHSEGPWMMFKAKHGVDGAHHIVARIGDDESDRALLICAPVGDNSEDYDNAKLILAAPALLAACRKAKEWLSSWASASPYIEVIQAAITKAEKGPL